MIAVFVKNFAHRPISIPTRVADAEVLPPCVGDIATVHSIEDDIEFCVRLTAPAGPQCWRGAVFAIGREGASVLVALGVELDDVVEISQSEMISIIRCQRVA